jgi:hypothetical protein
VAQAAVIRARAAIRAAEDSPVALEPAAEDSLAAGRETTALARRWTLSKGDEDSRVALAAPADFLADRAGTQARADILAAQEWDEPAIRLADEPAVLAGPATRWSELR